MQHDLKKRKPSYTQQIVDFAHPEYFARVRFIEGRKIYAEVGTFTWVPGDNFIYEEAALAIIRSLSKGLVSAGTWKRYHPLVPGTYSIEGGRLDSGAETGQTPHAHFNLALPTQCNEETFKAAFIAAAEGNPWVAQDRFATFFEKARRPVATVAYSCKEGPSRFGITG